MKHRLLRILSIISLVAILLFIQAGIALAVDYYLYVKVSSESGTSDYAPLAFAVDINNQKLADLGYISDSGLDTRVTYAGNELKHMVAEDKLAFVAPEVKGGIDYSYRYTMGNEVLDSFSMIPGYDGYVTVSDDASLEFGSDFKVELKGYVDTSAIAAPLVYKQSAFTTYVSDSTDVTATVLGTPGNTSPTGHNDPESEWADETEAYDDNLGSSAEEVGIPVESWSAYLELTHSAIDVEGVRFYADYVSGEIGKIDVDLYFDGDWNDLYEGAYADESWESKYIGGIQPSVTKARVRFYNSDESTPRGAMFYEFDFLEVNETKSVTAIGVSSGEHKVEVGIYDDVTSDCVELSGPGSDDNINCGTDASFNVASFTIEAWIYMTDLSTDETYHFIASKTDFATGWGFAVWPDGDLSLYTGASGVRAGAGVITTGSWHYVVAQNGGGTTKIWVDGDQKVSTGDAYTFHDASNFVIGNKGAISYGDFRGKIEEMRFSDKVRTPAEIADAWNSGNGKRLTADGNTIALWHFNEGAGTDAYDSTGTNDGTLSAGVEWKTGYIPEPALAIKIDDVVKDSTSWINESVPDNDNDWLLMGGNSMPYAEYYRHTVSETLVAWYQPNDMINGTTLPDKEGTAQDAAITWGSLPDGISTTIGALNILNLQNISKEAEEGAYLELFGEAPAEWEGLYEGEEYNVLPGSEVISELAAAGQIPLKLFWVPVIFAIAIFAGFFIYSKTKNIMGVAIAGGVVIGLFCAIGMLVWWVIIPYAIISVAMCVSEKTYGF